MKAGQPHLRLVRQDDGSKPVTPGTYYWRVGATQKAGSAVKWSQFRHVNVTA